MFDLAIIGGGPAGVAAGVYAARKRLKTVFVAEAFGGQSTDSLDIQNWIGTKHIPGIELAKALEAHLREYAGDIVTLKTGERATKIAKSTEGFLITTDKGTCEAKTVLITTGGSRKKLDVPGAAEFENKGIVYCASCDGPLFAGQDTVVIGAGNAGFETAAQLLAYAKSVTLLNRSGTFDKADAKTVEAVRTHANMTILANTIPVKVEGAMFVKSLTVTNTQTNETKELPVGGIFVEIGALPATSLAQGLVEFDQFNHIKVDPRTQRTSQDGVWAAGDCTDGLYHQNNIAAGDAVKALEDIYLYIKSGA
ncbi:MAG TPA: FAD-dependent oxidoreductase [Candidatus Paceibacterota bacterium]|jgi:alkyl hydroperoxide reductase subunit F|nr:FAD-dependent oxidoreductase [Candidatus Paceibacterota bacterium]